MFPLFSLRGSRSRKAVELFATDLLQWTRALVLAMCQPLPVCGQRTMHSGVASGRIRISGSLKKILAGAAAKLKTKGKGCDIGYALAASSCEGANSVDACTVTALDAITAFAVPNPNCPSQSRRFFQVWLPVGSPRRANHSAYFGSAKFYLSQPFQPSTEAKVNICFKTVNACFRCNVRFLWS
jgi:hypothetical protein